MLAIIAAVLVMSSQTPDADPPLDCANAMTTMEMNDCAAQDVEAEEVRMRAYLERAVQEVRDNSDSPELGLEAASQMATAQTAWEAYAEAECAGRDDPGSDGSGVQATADLCANPASVGDVSAGYGRRRSDPA